MSNSPIEESLIELALPDGPLIDNEEISDIFASRLGGPPVLINKIEIPKCGRCKCPLFFILQMDCPLPEVDRILYVFACNTAKCSSDSAAWHSYFHYLPKVKEQENEQFSNIQNSCEVDFASTEKALSSLHITDSSPKLTTFLFQEYPRQFPCISFRICEEFWNEPSSQKKNIQKMTIPSPITPAIGEEADLYEKIMPIGVDKEFEYFQKRVAAYPRQCVRYSPGGKILPYSSSKISLASSLPLLPFAQDFRSSINAGNPPLLAYFRRKISGPNSKGVPR